MKVDLIIFDLDGTLINSIPDLTDSLNQVSTNKLFTENEIAGLVGGGVSKLIENAFNISSTDKAFEKVFNSFLNIYGNNHSRRSYLYNNVIEILKHFDSKKLVILSNKLDRFTKQIVKDFDIYQYFDLVLGATDGIAKKPSGEPIEFILRELGILAGKALMVGDSEPDIMTAKNSGIKSIAVTYGYRSRKELIRLKPDYLINDLTELKSIVE